MLRSARHWGRVRQERVLPAPQPQLFRRPQLPPRAHGPGPARRHRHTSQLFRTGQMAAASVRSVYRSNRYVRAQLSAQIDAAVQKGPRRIARFRARVPMARVKLQSAARHQDRAAGIDRQQGARRSAGFRRTAGNRFRSRGKENDVKERYEKPKITYGRAEAGAVLLSILLRPLSNSLECFTYATRPDRLIQPKILGRQYISAFGVSSRTCSWRQTTPKERKNGASARGGLKPTLPQQTKPILSKVFGQSSFRHS